MPKMCKTFLAIVVILAAAIAGCQFDPMTVPTTILESMGDWLIIGEICLPIDKTIMHSIQFQLSDPTTLVVGSGTIPAHTVPPGAEKMFFVNVNYHDLIGRRDLVVFSLPLPGGIEKVDASGWTYKVYGDGTPYWTNYFRPGPDTGLMYQVRFDLSAEAVFCEAMILHDFGE